MSLTGLADFMTALSITALVITGAGLFLVLRNEIQYRRRHLPTRQAQAA
ncbi:MAG: hypothetical protein ABI361_09100 [Nitrososphaera sp.]